MRRPPFNNGCKCRWYAGNFSVPCTFVHWYTTICCGVVIGGFIWMIALIVEKA